MIVSLIKSGLSFEIVIPNGKSISVFKISLPIKAQPYFKDKSINAKVLSALFFNASNTFCGRTDAEDPISVVNSFLLILSIISVASASLMASSRATTESVTTKVISLVATVE